MSLSVPLSRFTPRVGGGSAFFVRPLYFMRCFYHHDKEAVGSCKSCGKALCVECAVDLGKGLACRNRCEESVRAITELVDRNIELMKGAAKAQVVAPMPIQRTGPPSDFVAAQLTSHIRETRHLHWMLGIFCGVVGAILLVSGFSGQLVVLDVVGACCLAFGVICFIQARRSGARPRLSETQTR